MAPGELLKFREVMRIGASTGSPETGGATAERRVNQPKGAQA